MRFLIFPADLITVLVLQCSSEFRTPEASLFDFQVTKYWAYQRRYFHEPRPIWQRVKQ